MNTSYAPDYFVKWLFTQDEAWLSADGRWWVISDGYDNSMAAQHIANLLLMLERTVEDIYKSRFPTVVSPSKRLATTWLHNSKLYKGLKDELFRRLS